MIVAILLILVVLLQIREQGSGLFGNSQSAVRTRRGEAQLVRRMKSESQGVFRGVHCRHRAVGLTN